MTTSTKVSAGWIRRYDLDRVIRVIEYEKPDIICLPEVTRVEIASR